MVVCKGKKIQAFQRDFKKAPCVALFQKIEQQTLCHEHSMYFSLKQVKMVIVHQEVLLLQKWQLLHF